MLHFLSFIFGLIVGSFLNVVINRTQLKLPFTGRSNCPHCKHELQPMDLVPVVSYILLKGRCRYCHKPISLQYPIVELLTAVVFTLFSLNTPIPSAEIFFLWTLAAFFIVVAVYDLKNYLILDKIIFPGLVVAVAFALYQDFSNDCGAALSCATISGLIGMLVVSGFFYLQHMVSKGRWIGFGDVKFGLMLGMVTGFPLSLFMLFISYISGAIVGLGLIAVGKKELSSKLPFGTFLAFAAVFALLYGEGLLNIYLDLIGLR